MNLPTSVELRQAKPRCMTSTLPIYLLDEPFEVKPLIEPVAMEIFARRSFLTPKVEGGQSGRGGAWVMIQAVCTRPCIAAYDADGATIAISLDGRCRAGALCDSNSGFIVPLQGNTSHGFVNRAGGGGGASRSMKQKERC